MRIYMNKAILFLLGLSLFYTMSNLLAPAIIEPGTVEHIDGTSTMDHLDMWKELNGFSRVIYAFGDSQCHQMEERSFYINGNQMPMCSRCTALFMWSNLGLVAAMFLRPEYDISLASVKMYPKRMRRAILSNNKVMLSWVLLCFLCVLPTGADGFYQLLTPYESTNFNRVLFSLPTGWFGGLAIGLMLNNVHFNIYGNKDDEDIDPEEKADMDMYWAMKRARVKAPYEAPVRFGPEDGKDGGGDDGADGRGAEEE